MKRFFSLPSLTLQHTTTINMSLLSQLAELSNPAPLVSPTSSRASSPAASSDAGAGSGSDVDAQPNASAAREHYVDVAPSLRRKKTLDESGTLRSGKYKGRHITAREAMLLGTGEGSAEEEDGEGVEVDELEQDEQDELDDDEEEEQDSDSPPTPASTSPPSRVRKSLRFASPSRSASPPASSMIQDDGTLASAAASDAALLATLRARAADDAARGRAVRDVKGAWEMALGVRIRAQAFVRGAGRIQVSRSIAR